MSPMTKHTPWCPREDGHIVQKINGNEGEAMGEVVLKKEGRVRFVRGNRYRVYVGDDMVWEILFSGLPAFMEGLKIFREHVLMEEQDG